MKRIFLLPSVLLFSVAIHAQKKGTTAKKTTTTTTASGSGLKTTNDSVSYAFGISIGQYMKSQNLTSINYAMLNKAIESSIKGQPGLMDMNQANQLMGRLAEQKTKAAAAGEKERGIAFLEKNKTRPGVIVTASGLQYEILKKGDGPTPKKTDTVVAHYAGSLIDGKEFDNSYKRGEPLTIPVAGVIPGWTEALQLMPVGSKWKLYIPSAIGYGDYGAGQDIPGGATLVFEVELLGIGSQKQ